MRSMASFVSATIAEARWNLLSKSAISAAAAVSRSWMRALLSATSRLARAWSNSTCFRSVMLMISDGVCSFSSLLRSFASDSALLPVAHVEAEGRIAGFHVAAFRRHHRDLEVPHVGELRRPEVARLGRGQRAGDVDARGDVGARDAHPLALAVRRELVAQRPSAADEEDGDGERNEIARTDHGSTTHSCALQGPSSRSVRPAMAAREMSVAFGRSSRRIITRAERPGRIRAGSILSSFTMTRKARRIDARALSCATAEISVTRPVYVVDG